MPRRRKSANMNEVRKENCLKRGNYLNTKKLLYFLSYIFLNVDRPEKSMHETSSVFLSMKRAIEVFQLSTSVISLSRSSTISFSQTSPSEGFPEDIFVRKVDKLTLKKRLKHLRLL